MGSLENWERVLWLLSVVATIILLLRMWKERLLLQYRWFSGYLGWSVLSAVVLWRVPRATNRYTELYLVFESVFWVLFILTTLELFSSVLRRYNGIASMGRRFIQISLGIALAIALLSMYIGANYPPQTPTPAIVVYSMFLFGRIVCLSVLVFLLIMSAGLMWLPVPLPANAVRFLLGYTLCFAARTMGYFSVNLKGLGVGQLVGTICISAALLCLVYWVIRLSAEGEQTNVIVGHRWSEEGEQRLIGKISSLNSALTRSRSNVDSTNTN